RARSSGATPASRISAGPSSSPPTRHAISPAVRPRGRSIGALLARRLEPLNDRWRQVQRLVGGDDIAALRRDVEDHHDISLCPQTLDDPLDPAFDRADQLLLALLRPVLEISCLLLERLLHGPQLSFSCLFGRGTEDHGLLVVLLHR